MRCSRIPLVVVLLMLWCGSAVAEVAQWNGFRALGIPSDQQGPLGYVVVEALDDGGLVDTVLSRPRLVDGCGLELACHCGQLRDAGVRYGAFGSMSRLGDQWTIELTLVDAHACTVAATAYLEQALAPGEIAPRAAALARQLTTPSTQVAQTATGGGPTRRIDATPAIVTTFTREQLIGLGIRTLEELFPLIPGFDVVDANWGGVILDQGLPSTLLFLSNGVPLVNGLNNFRALGRDFRSSLAHVDRIEIVRGPGGVLWGQNAFLGVVNILTDTPTRRAPSVDAGTTLGSLDTQELWARGRQNRGAYTFTASVDAGRRVGPSTFVPDSPYAVLFVPPPLPFGNGGTTQPRPDLWFDGQVRLAFADRLELTVQNLTSEQHYEISPRGPLLERGRGGSWKKTHRLYMARGALPLYEAVGASVTARATASRYEYYSQEVFAVQPRWPADLPQPAGATRDLAPGVASVQGNDRPRVAHQLDARVTHDYTLGLENHLTVGTNVQHMLTPPSLATVTGIDESPSTPTVSFGSKRFLALSAYVFDELQPTSWLALNAGARVQLDAPRDTEPGIARGGWTTTTRLQAGTSVRAGRFGGKLVYAEGFRPPDAVQLFSRVGTEGNPLLRPEQSRELASLVSAAITDGLTLRLGGNVTRISRLILLDPLAVTDPTFLYKPVNRGTIDVASGFVEAQLSSRFVDGFASWHVTGLRESDPLGTGIPLARHTAALAAIWRPFPDLSLFVRGSVASPRELTVVTAQDDAARVRTTPTVRTAIGITLADVIDRVDLQLVIDNPLLRAQEVPYQLDGTTAGLIERRNATEVFATLRYEQ